MLNGKAYLFILTFGFWCRSARRVVVVYVMAGFWNVASMHFGEPLRVLRMLARHLALGTSHEVGFIFLVPPKRTPGIYTDQD